MDMKNARYRLIIIATVALLGLVPVAATGAISLWEDVPHDSVFVNDTNWMKVTGISKGCNPPDNTQYCPEEFVKRQQMAAFLHRLSVGKIVDAATAVEAEMAEVAGFADEAAHAEEADFASDADLLDGLDSTEIMSSSGSVTTEGLAFVPLTTNPIRIASLSGFDIPADGGVVTAQANVTAEPDFDTAPAAQLGLVWIVVDGDGTCSQPVADPASAGFYYLPTVDGGSSQVIIDTTSTMITAAASAGSAQIDLCSSAIGTKELFLNGHLTATWVPVTSAAGVTAGISRTASDILNDYAALIDD